MIYVCDSPDVSQHQQVAEAKAYIVDWEQNGVAVCYADDRSPGQSVQLARKLSEAILKAFPEEIIWSAKYPSYMDFEAMEVDDEYTSRIQGWIESNTEIFWWQDEPVLLEWKDFTMMIVKSARGARHGKVGTQIHS